MSIGIKRKYSEVELDNFSRKLSISIAKWDTSRDLWADSISKLPTFFEALKSDYFDDTLLVSAPDPNGITLYIEKALEFIIEEMDYLPEAIMGPSGYADDVYIAARSLKYLDGIFSRTSDPSVEKIILEAEEMLGKLILNLCNAHLNIS
tara:strand:- start:44 stop:490 length:447 start_codon:yes stop_codon:yes gene_type:complete